MLLLSRLFGCCGGRGGSGCGKGRVRQGKRGGSRIMSSFVSSWTRHGRHGRRRGKCDRGGGSGNGSGRGSLDRFPRRSCLVMKRLRRAWSLRYVWNPHCVWGVPDRSGDRRRVGRASAAPVPASGQDSGLQVRVTSLVFLLLRRRQWSWRCLPTMLVVAKKTPHGIWEHRREEGEHRAYEQTRRMWRRGDVISLEKMV